MVRPEGSKEFAFTRTEAELLATALRVYLYQQEDRYEREDLPASAIREDDIKTAVLYMQLERALYPTDGELPSVPAWVDTLSMAAFLKVYGPPAKPTLPRKAKRPLAKKAPKGRQRAGGTAPGAVRTSTRPAAPVPSAAPVSLTGSAARRLGGLARARQAAFKKGDNVRVSELDRKIADLQRSAAATSAHNTQRAAIPPALRAPITAEDKREERAATGGKS